MVGVRGPVGRAVMVMVGGRLGSVSMGAMERENGGVIGAMMGVSVMVGAGGSGKEQAREAGASGWAALAGVMRRWCGWW